MNSRRRLQSLLEHAHASEPVVCLHTWGRYPFETLGKGHLWPDCDAIMLAEVYEQFWRMFPCDWLHVREGMAPPGALPKAQALAAAWDRSQVTYADVDTWVQSNADGQTLSKQDVLAAGMYDHVRVLSDRVGDEVMVFPNQGAPGSGFPALSWEDQLILIQERPDLVQHFVRLDDERFLQRVYAARDCGADGYIFSEGYDGVCDLISPSLFEQVFLEPKRAFYESVRQAGLWGIGYFLGGIEPYLDTINRIRPDALMIEESKKSFILDPVTIRKKLDPNIVLFGNLDSYLLLTGTFDQIRAEVRRQAHAMDYGSFVFINGSPICPGTPPDNLHVFLDTAREMGN